LRFLCEHSLYSRLYLNQLRGNLKQSRNWSQVEYSQDSNNHWWNIGRKYCSMLCWCMVVYYTCNPWNHFDKLVKVIDLIWVKVKNDS
jgi:hypothetical protein